MLECTLPILSLFSGAGGFDEGFRQAGFTSLLAVDVDSAAVTTFRRNHPNTRVEQRDLSTLPLEDLVELWESVADVPPVGIIGGPPCQAFSVGNRNLRPDDPRRRLTEHFARLLEGLNQRQPLHFFIFENVASLHKPLHREDFEDFCRLFEQAGFRLFTAILDAQWFGVPQKRLRLIVVGLNTELYPDARFKFAEAPSLTSPSTVRSAIADLPEPAYFSRGLRPSDIPYHPNHWTMVPRSPKFSQSSQDRVWPRGRSFRMLGWDVPSWTVAYGNREVHIHPDGHRRLSVYEAMLLQGFPTTYVLEGTLSDQFRLVSDAVPPPLASTVARALTEVIQPRSAMLTV